MLCACGMEHSRRNHLPTLSTKRWGRSWHSSCVCCRLDCKKSGDYLITSVRSIASNVACTTVFIALLNSTDHFEVGSTLQISIEDYVNMGIWCNISALKISISLQLLSTQYCNFALDAPYSFCVIGSYFAGLFSFTQSFEGIGSIRESGEVVMKYGMEYRARVILSSPVNLSCSGGRLTRCRVDFR